MRRRAGWLAVGALALAVLSACSSASANPSPSATPEPPSASPSPSPAPSITVDADGRALPGFVTVDSTLPAAQTAPSDLLAQSGPGWSLQTYRPQVETISQIDGVYEGVPATVQVVYLVAPEGQRYQMLELDAETPILIESWSAGETYAYVRQCSPLDCEPAANTQTLDLLTGEIAPVDAIEPALHVGATLPGSVRWWQDSGAEAALQTPHINRTYGRGWQAASVSPNGDYLAVVRTDSPSAFASAGMAIVDAETGVTTDLADLWHEPLECVPFRWRADGALDVSCYDAQRDVSRVFAVGPGADDMKENRSAVATPPQEGPWVEPDFYVSEGVWAGPYTADAQSRRLPAGHQIGLARNAGFEPLTVPDATVGSAHIVAVVNGQVFVKATQANNLALETAWVYNPVGDEWTELGPLPSGGPTRGLLASQGVPASGMTSWVVAP